jgi:hypothetical protein
LAPGWNVAGDLLWGYYFTDHDPLRLEVAASILMGNGYRLVGITAPGADSDEKTYWLHMEKLEHHTVRTLRLRNIELAELARSLCVETYDGMDVSG